MKTTTTNQKPVSQINEKDLQFKFNLLAVISELKKEKIVKHFEDLAENRKKFAGTLSTKVSQNSGTMGKVHSKKSITDNSKTRS